MLDNNKIEALLTNQPDISYAQVEGDGYHYQVTVVSAAFDGLNQVKRQQKIYALLSEWIADGSLHAVTMKTMTPAEWENKNG